MKRTALWILLSIALPVSARAQVTAEPSFRAGTFMLTVEIGGAAFTDFERTQARPVSGDLALGDFSRRVSARTAGTIGGWVSYGILNGFAIRAGLSYVPSSFTVWNDETAQRALDDVAPESRDPGYASLGIWMANASAVFRFPHSFGRVAPYAIAGGGVVRYVASDDAPMPPEARSRFADAEWQSGAVLLGIGAAIPLQRRNLIMSFEVTNHLSRTPLGEGSAGEIFELSGVQMQIDPDPATSGYDKVSLTSHLRLALGLTLPLR